MSLLVLETYAQTARAAHDELTRLDQVSGDGDFGDNLCDGLDAALAAARTSDQPALRVAARVFLDEVGGTSGPLIGLLLDGIARAQETGGSASWAAGVRAGLTAVSRVGEAEPGDRTMVDALLPAAEALEAGDGLEAVAQAALDGARETARIRARRGRAAYLGDRAIGSPDPGALGVALLFWSLAKVEGDDAAALDPLDDLLGV